MDTWGTMKTVWRFVFYCDSLSFCYFSYISFKFLWNPTVSTLSRNKQIVFKETTARHPWESFLITPRGIPYREHGHCHSELSSFIACGIETANALIFTQGFAANRWLRSWPALGRFDATMFILKCRRFDRMIAAAETAIFLGTSQHREVRRNWETILMK